MEVDRESSGCQSADRIMSFVRKLEEALKSGDAIVGAIDEYLLNIREVKALELLLGEDENSSRLADLPRVNGLFRWSVINNLPEMTSACIKRGADVAWDNHWGLIYSLANGYNDVACRIASEGDFDLNEVAERWESAAIKGADNAQEILDLINKLRGEIPESLPMPAVSLDTESHSEVYEQIPLFA